MLQLNLGITIQINIILRFLKIKFNGVIKYSCFYTLALGEF